MASPLKSNNNAPRPDISAIQQSSNAHTPGSWQYQLTESMLMHNTGGQDMGTGSVRSKHEPPQPSEESNEKIAEENVQAPRDEHNNDMYDISNPQRFSRYIDRRFAPISDDGRSHKPIRPFSDYEEEDEPKAARIPYGSVLFLIGFVCPPSWWIGTFYPFTCFQTEQKNIPKIERRWRSANRVMTALSILLIAVLLGIMGWYISTYK
ncbi:hypothetical protein K450DRAFT_233257 [Umbelopsis ramanniana AG]|uniref:Uncharacterized protein n=1 Tax=Umbelopsis ramanniana AG TaxID=1314678 RepID=A0AAD5EDQ7_UMBRA|nr:uncharacterized protein K450DRAFT_233257 [Umbelopsis ramanniana AG]KAI8581135.1 hypothetical protein K450DRAFT_233257 [Umbelopsis ramanniana AG]